MRLALLFLLVVTTGCKKEARTAPPENRVEADAATAVTPPVADAGLDPCVADCVARNQMKATSPEQIERECRAECAGGAPP